MEEQTLTYAFELQNKIMAVQTIISIIVSCSIELH